MTTPAGQLTIRLQPGNGRQPVAIESTRPQYLARLFNGKPLEEALQAIPLLFNICRGAQSVAAVRAAEQALGWPPAQCREQNRETLLQLEMLHEHLWKLLMDLPPSLGLAARQTEMAAASRQLGQSIKHLRQHNCTLQAPGVPGDAQAAELLPDRALINTLQHLLFGETGAAADRWEGLAAGAGLAGALLRALAPLDWVSAIRPEAPPAMARAAVGSLLAAETPNHYIQLHLPAGSGFESGPLLRMGAHPPLEAACRRPAQCLSLRLVALLLETDKLLRDLYPAPRHKSGEVAPPQSGCCQVETSRGRLTHALSLASDRSTQALVKKIVVLSPTDWHFHSRGIVANLLSEQPAADSDKRYRGAELLIKLINPCCAYRLTLVEGGTQRARRYA
ncbi:hypothetical protein FKG94_15280 [Exilibacterium tricleocarpae]|uniref:Hydrogenase n=1 Tax=Exilibacterium tricleocarpae TaxID=2591008 RepID=A0A545TFG7_9GAMM|nr:hypothetical protein [Exilibacterium tricleocarpae]TQV75972.1 hypothetical protein FKG94_15280 [Exilibacterium tricleocarpae]